MLGDLARQDDYDPSSDEQQPPRERKLDWVLGALAAQDAYRGDYAGGWPSPEAPRVGVTGGLPGGFADAMRGTPSRGDATGQPGRMGSLAEMTPTPAEHVRDVARYVGESLVHPFEMTNAAMQGVTPEVPGMWSEADDYRRDVLNRDLNTFTNKTAAGMVFDPMMALGTKVGVPGYSLGSGARLPARERPLEGVAGAAEAPFSPADVSKLTPRNINKFTSGEAQRVAFPGVYKDPRLLAQEAALKVAPEHPALKQLFGVTRDDLYGISQQGTRQGNVEPRIWYPDTPRGSYAAERIMNPKNAQRMVDALGEAEKYPHLTRGMDAWYVMDPAFQRMVQLVGREQAIKDYQRFNMTVPPFSAGSNVLTEINRGTAANMMAKRGDYPTFEKYAGVAEDKRGTDFPAELRDVMGHAYHGIQADPVTRYLATGEHGYHRDTVKIPLYTQASGVPETGFQTRLPVPDAHFARASGMADVRENKSFADYMSGSEYRPFGPWYRENVAKPLGIEAVPAQGRMWGLYAPQTGVDTAVGAPKLELLAQSIWERAKRLGVDPAVLRDQVLRGDNHALWLMGIPTGVAAGVAARGRMGDLAAQDTYQ